MFHQNVYLCVYQNIKKKWIDLIMNSTFYRMNCAFSILTTCFIIFNVCFHFEKTPFLSDLSKF